VNRLVSLLPAVCLVALSASGQTAPANRFSAEDFVKVVRVSDPQIAPDGKSIAITVGRANLKENRYDNEIDLVDVQSHRLRVMTHGKLGAGSPRWSPSGDRLAYLAQDADKRTQLWVLPMGGGDSLQITHSKTSVKTYAWRPDGQAFVYGAEDEAPEKKDQAKFEDAFEVGNNGYVERIPTLPVHLWTVSAAGENEKRLTSGSWSLPDAHGTLGVPLPLAYTPDGKSILFVRAESPVSGDYSSSRLELLDVATGAMHALTKSEIEEGNPKLSPDGTLVAYSYPRDGKRRNESSAYTVAVSATGGTGKNAVADLDHAVDTADWMPGSRSLLVAANDGTHVGFWLQPLDGAATKVSVGSVNPAGGLSVGKDGSVAFTATGAVAPPELFYMAHVGDAPVQLTHLQTVTDGLTLGRQETVEWKSYGMSVDGVLTYPPDYVAGRKYPLVLYIHGGPTATSMQTFSAPSQVLAAQGWLVLEPNYRGSNNEGNAFEASIVRDASAGPGRDIMAGVKAVEARGIVDTGKVAVSGWSYGGQMTAWLIGNYPEAWKAAVAGAPVTDLVDQYTLSDNNINRADGYGPSPFVGDNLKSYAMQSPISYAWRAKAPTLIMSDVGDWRVTTTQAYKLYHALKDNQVTVKFMAYPVAGHFPSDPVRTVDIWRRWVAWLDLYLNGAAPAVVK
jgi:dipeptidyl aminopeptidase/acylaminoacyl peptidase